MLAATKINQFYGGSHTLWDITMEIPKGSVTCLMGRNGMGKTTLLRCVMGLVGAKAGSIVYEGTDLRSVAAEQRLRDVGVVAAGPV